MRIDADSRRNGEIARGRFAFEILILNAAEGDAANLAMDRELGRSTRTKRDFKIVRESIRGAEGENGESDGRAGQSLDNIVDGAIATAGKDRVTPVRDRTPGIVSRFPAGAANREFGMNSGRLDDADGMIEFTVAPRTTRVWIEQNGGFVHAFGWPRIEFNARINCYRAASGFLME